MLSVDLYPELYLNLLLYDTPKMPPKPQHLSPVGHIQHSSLWACLAFASLLYIFSSLLQFTSLLLIEGIFMYLFITIKPHQHLVLCREIFFCNIISNCRLFWHWLSLDIWKCHSPSTYKHLWHKLWPRWSLKKYCVTYNNMYPLFGS